MSHHCPRISIGLPVFNGEKYLADALDSLLAQTYDDFEVIISDNCSTDRTQDICRDYAGRDRRIRYERQAENLGACWNHNRVFHLARGKYFKWAAYDDLHGPLFLEMCASVLDENPDVSWCHPQSIHINATGHILEGPGLGKVSYALERDTATSCRKPVCSRESPSPHDRFKAILTSDRGNQDVFGLIRVSAMRKTALMVPYYGMDKVFVAALSLTGRFQEIRCVQFYNRVHADGSGALATAKSQQAFIAPRVRSAGTLTRLKLWRCHFDSVRRAELSAAERTQCYRVLFGHLFQVRKWRRIAEAAWRGIGTGGGYLSAIDQSDCGRVMIRESAPVTAASLIADKAMLLSAGI